jgi:hypothetical protein
MRARTCFAGLIILPVLFFAFPAYCEDHLEKDPANTTEAKETEGTERLYNILTGRNPFTGSRLLYLPSGDLYPPYAADPVRPGFAIQPVHVRKGRIGGTSSSRINLKAGGQVGLVRSQSVDNPDLGWQLSLLGGFNDQNDLHESLDNIGWDGHYGLTLTAAGRKHLAFKLGWLHVSSHLGDEYIEKTGRKRISYTREEIAAGVSWFMTERWRSYIEAGRAISMSNKELQEPWRRQSGIEYESAPVFWRRRMAWYAALDAQSFQERDWRVDVSLQTGFLIRSEGRTWRIGAEWYNGRPPIGEFFQFTERYISIGIWIDI